MFAKLEEVQARYRELNSMLADPGVASDPQQYQKLAKEHAHIQEIVEAYKRFREVEEEIASNKSLLSEDDDERNGGRVYEYDIRREAARAPCFARRVRMAPRNAPPPPRAGSENHRMKW